MDANSEFLGVQSRRFMPIRYRVMKRDQHVRAKDKLMRKIEKRLYEKAHDPYYEGSPILQALTDCVLIDYHSFWINYHNRRIGA